MATDALSAFGPLVTLSGGGSSQRASGARSLREVAQEFESLLLLQMVKQMRQSFLEECAAGEGFGAGTMTETVDVELARALAAQGGLGLAAVLERGLARLAPGVAASAATVAPPTPQPTTGVSAPDRTCVGLEPVSVPVVAEPDLSLSLALEGPRTSAFGWRRDPLHGERRFHGGIDVAAAYGREVPVAGPGRVVRAEDSGGYGLMVEVEHAGGVRTRYAHLSSLAVVAGQELAQDEVVGRVGRSGRATGHHLHFEVLVDGRRVDPDGVLDAGAAQIALKLPAPRDDSPGEHVPASLPAME
jgi:murein DD-endopeptidase MepM/ murein hydrolase activator NlpD